MTTDILVTGELQDFGDEWEVNAFGGGSIFGPIFPHEVRLRRPTEAEAKQAFIDTWNSEFELEYTPDQFSWVYNSGRSDS